MAIFYNAHDFATALLALLPAGRAWTRSPGSKQRMFTLALAQVYARNTARALGLLIDAFPATTVELLPEWEQTLGLPDPCAGEAPGLQQRVRQVVARLTDSGGQSAAYFRGLAQELGYEISITQFCPSRFGSVFGASFGGEDWAHTWQVNAPTFTVQRFQLGGDAFGESFAHWDNSVLQCELSAAAPAHTILNFSYEE